MLHFAASHCAPEREKEEALALGFDETHRAQRSFTLFDQISTYPGWQLFSACSQLQPTRGPRLSRHPGSPLSHCRMPGRIHPISTCTRLGSVWWWTTESVLLLLDPCSGHAASTVPGYLGQLAVSTAMNEPWKPARSAAVPAPGAHEHGWSPCSP